jgi:hypothetical protein
MTAPPGGPETGVGAPLVQHPGRVLTVLLVLGFVVTLGAWAVSSAETETGRTRNATALPASLEHLSPGPGELVRLQDTILVDLRDDLTGVLLLQPPAGAAFEVPEDQTERVVPLGQLSFRTGPDRELVRFEPGTYRATVLYWPQAKARPEQPTSYTWEFRAGA